MFKSYNFKDLILLLNKNLKQKRLSKKVVNKMLKSFKIFNLIKK